MRHSRSYCFYHNPRGCRIDESLSLSLLFLLFGKIKTCTEFRLAPLGGFGQREEENSMPDFLTVEIPMVQRLGRFLCVHGDALCSSVERGHTHVFIWLHDCDTSN